MAAADLETILNQAKSLSDSDTPTVWAQEVQRRLAEVTDEGARTISREELTERLNHRLG